MSMETLAENVVVALKEKELKVAFAESCTGGMVSAAITSVVGSSDVFDMSIVTYSNLAKTEYTDVTDEILSLHGAVSEETAVLMASGIRKRSKSDIGIGITGFASGDDNEKSSGTVYIALAYKKDVTCKHFLFSGDRQSVRTQATMEALNMLKTIDIRQN